LALRASELDEPGITKPLDAATGGEEGRGAKALSAPAKVTAPNESRQVFEPLIKELSAFWKAVSFSVCSVMANALRVTATLPLRFTNLPIRSAVRDPLAMVSTETTAILLVSGASVDTQTTGIFERDARRIQVPRSRGCKQGE